MGATPGWGDYLWGLAETMMWMLVILLALSWTLEILKVTGLMHKTVLAAAAALAVSAMPSLAAGKEPLNDRAANQIRTQFSRLMDLANRHDFKGLHAMFWQSPSALLVAKSAIPAEGNWAGFWGNEAIDRKLHDIGTSGPVVLEPDYTKLKVVGLTHATSRLLISGSLS